MANLARYASGMDDLVSPTWRDFMQTYRKHWQAGEHVFVYGETGSGKTDMAFHLLNTEPYGVAFITKPRDPIFTSQLTRGYKRISSWPPRSIDAQRNHHFLLSAKVGKNMDEEIANQRDIMPPAFNHIYRDGGWTVLFDETLHLTTELGMSRQLTRFAYLARSNELTGIYCSQRPKNIPVIIPQSCKWAFMARSRREDDISVLAELGYSRQELRARLAGLRSLHDFLFVDPQGELPLMIANTHK